MSVSVEDIYLITRLGGELQNDPFNFEGISYPALSDTSSSPSISYELRMDFISFEFDGNWLFNGGWATPN